MTAARRPVLVDTSAWIEALASPARLDLGAILEGRDVVTTPLIVMELLQGAREAEYPRLERALLHLPLLDADLPQARVMEAVGLYRTARRQGRTIRSSIDCLIAATAITHRVTVLHRDRDFPALATVSVLDQENAAPGARVDAPHAGA